MAAKITSNRRSPKGAEAPKSIPEDVQGLALRVISKRDGFRRAGRSFGPDPLDIPLSKLSRAEYAALTTEPMLVTYLVEEEPGQDEAEAPTTEA